MLMQRLNLLFLFILINCFKNTFGQSPPADSVQEIKVPSVIHYITQEAVLNNDFRMRPLDTTLNDIHVVQLNVKHFHNNLSNNGSATYPQLFNLNRPVLTTFGNHSFDLYNIEPGDIRYYKTNKRFSEMTYHLSGGKESQVKLTMAQNILSNWNIGFDFKRLGSLGFLNNGTTFNSNFDAFTWYRTKNNRYNLFASALWNSIRNKVNGGVVTDTLYDNESVSNNELNGLGIYLNDASIKSRNRVFSFMHYYHFGYKKAATDSTRTLIPLFRLQTHTEYESGNYIYKESSDTYDYYDNYNFSLDQTYDSLHYDNLINRISIISSPLSLKDTTFRIINFEVTGGQQLFHFYQIDLDSTRQNTFAEAAIFGPRNKKKVDYTLKGKYVLDGENKDEYSADADARIPLSIFGNIIADFSQASLSPAFIQTVYRSNHFAWDNEFDKTTVLTAGLKYELPKYHLSAGVKNYSISNYIYFSEESFPLQFDGTIKIQQAFIGKNFHFGKFRFNNTVYYQRCDENLIIPLPDFLAHNSLYYESWLFKKKMFAQIGIDFHYTSAYFAPAFNPAVNIFYLQHEIETNGYVLADVFFNFKIKTARVFIKLHNAGDELIRRGYYLTPHYPMPGRLFQFGLNWRFFD
jgi:hypothetical protein